VERNPENQAAPAIGGLWQLRDYAGLRSLSFTTRS
jgi:hypothetical protein